MAIINLEYHSDKDVYSDGDIEIDIMRLVKQGNYLTSLFDKNTSWPVLCHLSPIRENLLEWFPFDPSAELLEVGGGCGALTGLLARKVKNVTVVELSRRRSEIILERYKNHDNIDIMVGNLLDMSFEKQFDYITMIGVLEYAGRYGYGSSPYVNLLEFIRGIIKDKGQLLLAIENKLGLKYWAGAREDHTGRRFDSIEGYPQNSGVKTFSKNELTEIFSKAGFNRVNYYYPMPDYKFPNIIFSDKYLPDNPTFTQSIAPGVELERPQFFNEMLALQSVINNNSFDVFANSFLVVAENG